MKLNITFKSIFIYFLILGATLCSHGQNFNTSFSTSNFPGRPEEGEYLADNNQPNKINILDIIGASTNGITEYTVSNFDGAMIRRYPDCLFQWEYLSL